jgi:peptidoglycan hydrolase-like protein with peptidoglycan-binding domain
VSADGRAWQSVLSQDRLESGLGFLRRFRQPGVCKETFDELAGEVTSMSPETWGAALGLAVGAAAGAASTRSVTGALRGGILMGSIGSALGHLADVFIPERVAQLADNLQDLVQERDGRVCELLRASDKLREPVIEHLQASLERECERDLAAHGGATGVSGPRTAGQCLQDNPRAERIVASHVSALEAINRGTCKVAAAIVERFDQAIDGTGTPRAADIIVPSCSDGPQTEPRVPAAVPSAQRRRAEQIL